MKRHITATVFCLFICAFSDAQTNLQNSIADYISQTGDYAVVYNGELEVPYNASLYYYLPYYISDKYSEGEIVYNGNAYAGQLLRLDLYRENLLILTPEKKFNVVIKPGLFKKAVLHGKTVIWLKSSTTSNLPTGYYFLLYNGRDIQLLQKDLFILRKQKVRGNSRQHFDLRTRFYLLHEDVYYRVNNKQSFVKVFPQLKKEINQYVKEYSLDFKREPEKALVSLAEFCQQQFIENR